ncbi:MAG: methyl-accepting chemotaxis protein [Firmicutes bacterium]|nr:methyl-accepting chemotaxis protein [Bacillota bacterium]
MNLMGKLTISKKIVMSYTVIIVIFVGTVIFSDISHNNTDRMNAYLLDYVNMRSTVILEYQQQFTELRRYLRATFMDSIWRYTTTQKSQTEERIAEMYQELLRIGHEYIVLVENDPQLTYEEKEERFEYISVIMFNSMQLIDIFERNYFSGGNGSFELENAVELTETVDRLVAEARAQAETINDIVRAELAASLQLVRIVNLVVPTFTVLMTIGIAFFMMGNFKKKVNSMVGVAHRVQDGDFEVNISNKISDELDVLSHTTIDMVDTFKLLVQQIHILEREQRLGDFEARIDETLFKGAYKTAAQNINSLVDSIVQDVLDTLDIITSYAHGDFEPRFKQLSGKKEIATTTVNMVRENLHNVHEAVEDLSIAATHGDFTKFVDVNKYSGDWKTTMQALNNFVAGVSAPVTESMEVLQKFAKGDLTAQVVGNYHGIFSKKQKVLNDMITTISSYIKEVSDVTAQMSNNNLNVKIDSHFVGEFYNIKLSINHLVESFNQILGEIRNSSDNLSAGTQTISLASQNLSDDVFKQVHSVDEIRQTVDKILHQIQTGTDNANTASGVAQNTQKNATKGNEAMQEMLSAMEEITKASDDILRVTKVIDGIAFQTNLLALNASVEAARAGEHGKGFAVVAEEVRTLAQRSKEAASETGVLIGTAVNKAGQGSEIAYRTADILKAIVEQIGEISNLVENVSSASDMQAESAKILNDRINDIATISNDVADTSKQTATTTQELSDHANVFRKMVDEFKLRA